MKKKIMAVALAGVIAAGGTGAVVKASEGGLFDNLIQKAVTEYVINVAEPVAAYSNEQANTIPGFLAGSINWFNGYIGDVYKEEVARAKSEIKAHADQQKKYYQDEVNRAGGQAANEIHTKTNEVIQQSKSTIDKLIQDELAKYNQ